MSTIPPPAPEGSQVQDQEQFTSARDAKAHAKAAKAYRKASRPWFKKKRFWLAGVVALFIIVGLLGGDEEDTASGNPSNGSVAAAPAGSAVDKEAEDESAADEAAAEEAAAEEAAAEEAAAEEAAEKEAAEEAAAKEAAEQEAAEKAAAEAATLEVSAQTLISELENNALAAAQTYEGKRIVVTGFVNNIDASGDYFSIRGDDEFTFTNVQLFIDESHLDAVMGLSQGQQVTVTGEVTSVGEILGYSVDVESIN